jgi:hypothetical protein
MRSSGLPCFRQSAAALLAAAGELARDHPHIARHRLAIGEACRISKEDFRRQPRDRSHPRVRHEQPRLRPLFRGAGHFFIQHFDLALQLLIESHQLAAPRAGMRRQHQLGQRLLSAVAP